MFLEVDNREFATIIAALRYWQRNGELDREEGTIIPPMQEYDVATDCGEFEPLTADEIDKLCEQLNCEPPALVGQLLAALERASAACDGKQRDYDWVGEAETAIAAAYRAGMGPKVSDELKRLLMAEIDNETEGGDSPATLETVKASLDSGYTPCDGFPVAAVKGELEALIAKQGNAPAERFVATADWESRAKV